MGYFALKKWFTTFNKQPYVDMIAWYADYILTPEERIAKKEREKQRVKNIAMSYIAIRSMIQ